MKPKIQPYGKLVEIAPNLFCLDGEWYETPFKRRMTIIRLKNGELVIHGAIQLEDTDYALLDKLGSVKHIVAPNFLHVSDAGHYAKHYPNAKVYASASAAKPLKKTCRVDHVLPEDWAANIREELDCIELRGTRLLGEVLLFHKSSRTLIITDMVFNMQNDSHGFEKMAFKINDIYKKFGPSRLFKSVFIKNKKTFSESLKEILQWDFDRVIVGHGDILPSQGKQAMKDGFSPFI